MAWFSAYQAQHASQAVQRSMEAAASGVTARLCWGAAEDSTHPFWLKTCVLVLPKGVAGSPQEAFQLFRRYCMYIEEETWGPLSAFLRQKRLADFQRRFWRSSLTDDQPRYKVIGTSKGKRKADAFAPAEPVKIDPLMGLTPEQVDEVQQLWRRLHEQGQRVVDELLEDCSLMVPHAKMSGEIRIDPSFLTVVEYRLLRHIMLNSVCQQEIAKVDHETKTTLDLEFDNLYDIGLDHKTSGGLPERPVLP